MKKHYFWALWRSPDGLFLVRFRSDKERQEWMKDMKKTNPKHIWYPIIAAHPEVRRIQRRMAQGEEITFPVEV